MSESEEKNQSQIEDSQKDKLNQVGNSILQLTSRLIKICFRNLYCNNKSIGKLGMKLYAVFHRVVEL